MSVDLNSMMRYVAALSVATERVTEFIKRVPGFSTFRSAEKTDTQEDVRVICVHMLALIIDGVICGIFPKTVVLPESPPHRALGQGCLLLSLRHPSKRRIRLLE